MTARLEHVPGDKVSGDWTGDCPHLTDPVTGRRMKAQVFVAVLPYSGLIVCGRIKLYGVGTCFGR